MPPSASSKPVVRNCAGMRWRVRRDCADWFFAAIAPRYHQIEHEPDAEEIKRSMRRVVCRLTPPSSSTGNLILKRQRFTRLRYYLKCLAFPSKAAREWRAALLVDKAGIPSFRPVALGERRRCGTVTECCLVSEEIPDTHKLSRFVESLDQHVPARDRRAFVRRLLHELADLLAKLQRAGLYHADLHGGNLLIRHAGGADFQLFLIDLDAVRRRGILARWHLCRSLALLARSVPEIMSRTNLVRLVAAYAQADGRLGRRWRTLVPRVAREDVKRHFELHESRDRRCLRTSTNFAVLRAPGRRVTYRRLLKDHPLVAGPSNTAPQDDRYSITRYQKPADARAAWSALHGLRIRHVGAPRPHILVESRVRGQPSCVLTETVPAARPLSDWLRRLPQVARGEAFRSKVALLRAVADRFHAACRDGVVHRRCLARNILAVQEADGWRVVFAQSPAVRFKRRLSETDQIRMLAQFASSVAPFSRTAAWRFYRGCFGGSPRELQHQAVRRVWRRIEARLRRCQRRVGAANHRDKEQDEMEGTSVRSSGWRQR